MLARSSTARAPLQENVMRTNTFAITVGEWSRMVLFPKISVSLVSCHCIFRTKGAALVHLLSHRCKGIEHACCPG
jgi:hypothetical protein